MVRRKRKQVKPTGAAPMAHLRGLGFALVFTAIFLLLITLLVSLTAITENVARWIMLVLCAFAVLVGSYQTGKSMGRTGWLNGAVIGLAYVVFMLLLALLLDLGLTARSLVTLAIGFALGAVGGVTGVNNR